jgi:hypothetical protein
MGHVHVIDAQLPEAGALHSLLIKPSAGLSHEKHGMGGTIAD